MERGILSVGKKISIAVDAASSPPTLVAHSMGGFAAANYVAHNSRGVRALVLLMPVLPSHFSRGVEDVDVSLQDPWGPPPPAVARHMFYSDVDDDEEAARVYTQLQAESPRAVWEATRYTNRVDVDSIDVPVLIMAGERDVITAPGPIGDRAESMKASFIMVQNCGHGVLFDRRWPQLCEQIESWLTSELRD